MLAISFFPPKPFEIHRTLTDGVQQAPHRGGQQTSHKAAQMKHERSAALVLVEEEERWRPEQTTPSSRRRRLPWHRANATPFAQAQSNESRISAANQRATKLLKD
ncbi:hypothetical protein MRX96_029935 [Rhipicephalus microplus]